MRRWLNHDNAAGRTISVHTNVNAIAMNSNTPMLAVPRWPETARLPNDATVVRALNNIARGVLVVSTSP